MGKKKSSGKTQAQLIRHGVYGVEEILSQTVDMPIDLNANGKRNFKKKHNAVFNELNVFMTSDRYTLFKNKGCTCVKCGIEGTFFALETGHGCDVPRAHFNLYALDKDGKEILMTKDHIQAASKGGPDQLTNYQTMCIVCNVEKGVS
jgi:5-methylcytosine-specific restriction endonuclease McrA